MFRDSEGFAGWLKWLVGIVISLLAAGSGTVALLNYINSPHTPLLPAKPTSTAIVCFIAGTVFNQDNNQPLPNVLVKYDPYNERSRLATTDSNGHFEANCASVEPKNFPLQLWLSHPGWCVVSSGTLETIRMGESRTAINIYVSDKLHRSGINGGPCK